MNTSVSCIISLECSLTGMPEPNLRWYRESDRGEVLIVDNEKYQISQLLNHGTSLDVDQIWYTLKVLNVQANDYTNYYCEGSNSMGTTRATIRLYGECRTHTISGKIRSNFRLYGEWTFTQ